MMVWFDAYTQNIDRTPRNANLLVWHRKLYPIDHGAALFFHHRLAFAREENQRAFCGDRAAHIAALGHRDCAGCKEGSRAADETVLREIVGMVPETWLEAIPGGVNAAERRAGYLEFFTRRLKVRQFLKRRRSVPSPASFDYAILRVVPRVERQEFINAGVVAFCLREECLAARIRLDAERLKAL